MENDYLWNKTGEDQEIEQLENALRIFSYQENHPPPLPVQIKLTTPGFSILRWRFAFAFAIVLTLFVGGLSVWLRLQSTDQGKLTIADFNYEDSKAAPVSSQASQPDPERIVVPNADKIISKPKVIKTAFHPVEVPKRNLRTLKRKGEPKIQLTNEEKFAFNQLMLALSITGSKLSEVKKMVNGGEENIPAKKSLR
jgi:hypothetical protein